MSAHERPAGYFDVAPLTPAEALERLRDHLAELDADETIGNGPYKNRRIATELRAVLALVEG